MKLKIKPTKNTVALRKLKFRKESDFNKFLKIVSKNTKELQRIKLPSKSDVKKKSGFNLLPLLALGALIAALLNKGKGSGDGDGVSGGDGIISGGDKIDSTSNVLRKRTMNNTKNDKKNRRKIDLRRKSRRKKRLLKRIRNKRKIDLKNKRKTNTKTKTKTKIETKTKTKTKIKVGKNDIKNQLKQKRKLQKIARETLRASKVLGAAAKSPQALAGALIVNDIMNNPVADGTMDAHLAYEKQLQKEKFKTEANKQKDLINKEIDQLIYTRSQLDVSDRRTYQHLTAKIEGLLVKSAAITPKAIEQQYIKKSSENPVILYPIGSQNTQPIINAPTSNQQSQSQSQAGNDVVGGQSDSLNISELLLLNKLSH